jgi:hypothetical protein
VRSEVDVLELDSVRLRRYVCVCGVCPRACPAQPVRVETHTDGAASIGVMRVRWWWRRPGRTARPPAAPQWPTEDLDDPAGMTRVLWEQLPTEPIPTYRAPIFPVLRVAPYVRPTDRGGIG